MEIQKALNSSDAIIVCISQNATTKEGYIQKEIRFALDKADEKPDGTIFVIPARLEECSLPDRLSQWQWVDVFRERGREWLLRGLALRANKVGAAISGAPLPDMGAPVRKAEKKLSPKLSLPPAPVPVNTATLPDTYSIANMEFRRIGAGKFTMGDDEEKHEVDIPYDYLLARFETTNESFKKFVDDSKFEGSWGVDGWQNKRDHPVVKVSWHTAQA